MRLSFTLMVLIAFLAGFSQGDIIMEQNNGNAPGQRRTFLPHTYRLKVHFQSDDYKDCATCLVSNRHFYSF